MYPADTESFPLLSYLQRSWHKLHQLNGSFTPSPCVNIHGPAVRLCRPTSLWSIIRTMTFSPCTRPLDEARFLPSDLSVTPLTFHVSPPAGHRKWLFHGCECAGVRGVQSAGPGPPVEGRIQCHGLLPGGTISVCNHCSGLLSLLGGRDETIFSVCVERWIQKRPAVHSAGFY